jgi:hypothetical protein
MQEATFIAVTEHHIIPSFFLRSSFAATWLFLIAAFVFSSCSVTQPVRVVEEGTTKAAVSIGGPFVPFGGLVVPLPYVNAGLIHGYTKNVTLTANLHATMAMLKNAAIDVGGATRLVRQDGWTPEITAKGQVYLFSDLQMIRNARVFPIVSVNASRLVGESSLLYAGVDQLIQFDKPNYFISPFAGTQFPLSERWSMQAELKWMASNINSEHGILRGTGAIGGHGDIALFFGFTYGLSQ